MNVNHSVPMENQEQARLVGHGASCLLAVDLFWTQVLILIGRILRDTKVFMLVQGGTTARRSNHFGAVYLFECCVLLLTSLFIRGVVEKDNSMRIVEAPLFMMSGRQQTWVGVVLRFPIRWPSLFFVATYCVCERSIERLTQRSVLLPCCPPKPPTASHSASRL